MLRPLAGEQGEMGTCMPQSRPNPLHAVMPWSAHGVLERAPAVLLTYPSLSQKIAKKPNNQHFPSLVLYVHP